ncbi:MAG: sirohydrochlorin chelatase [Spirulinaceae cyanobacterium SM2_1_0]|nr:sirohydrochlorin chelatase [Spirulinaceae cyanobacterium SM2_1_0]
MARHTHPAILLVAHGSRSPLAQAALAQLAAQVQQQWPQNAPEPWLATACLELAPQPLHEQIRAIATRAQQAGRSHLTILPLFLQPGVHACEDIPAEIAIAQPLAPLPLKLLPYLGSHSAFRACVADRFGNTPGTARLLLAHGSRRPGSDRPLATLAAQLAARFACWSVPPSLATQVAAGDQQGERALTIQPYFLFPGRLTADIAAEVARLQTQYPDIHLQLQPPLATGNELAGRSPRS